MHFSVVSILLCLGFLAVTLLVKWQIFEVLLIIVGLSAFESPACARSAPFHLSFGVFLCLSTKQTWKLFVFENSSFIHQRNLAKGTCIIEGTVFSNTQTMTVFGVLRPSWFDWTFCTLLHIQIYMIRGFLKHGKPKPGIISLLAGFNNHPHINTSLCMEGKKEETAMVDTLAEFKVCIACCNTSTEFTSLY